MKYAITLFLGTLLMLNFPNLTNAKSTENAMYKIQIENINPFASPNDTENINVYKNDVSKDSSGTNYKIDLGENYSSSNEAFTFTISGVNIDFGLLSPTNPTIRSNTLKIKNINKAGYKVTGIENHELTESKRGIKIPDTTCDDGKCTDYISSKWDNTLTYGFGYRCESSKTSCVENDFSFTETNYFKQFPNSSKNESPITMLSEGSSLGQEASIIYKLNISSSQPQNHYSNMITFIAIPNY